MKKNLLSFLLFTVMSIGFTFAIPSVGDSCATAGDIPIGSFSIQACNLGASVVGTGPQSFGDHYQRGRNTSFKVPTEGCDARPSACDSPYSDDFTTSATGTKAISPNPLHTLFITGSDRLQTPDSTLRGGTENDGPTTLPTYFDEEGRQGPCSDGYHVPSMGERNQLINEWATTNGQILTTDANGYHFFNDFPKATKFANDLILPRVGIRNYTLAEVKYRGVHGFYWSSSPYSTDSRLLGLGASYVQADGFYPRTQGFSVRCFKDRRYEICDSITDVPNSECKALVDFYYSTNGDGWTKGYSGRVGEAGKTARLTGDKACDWFGINNCTNTTPKHVGVLNLIYNNLSGTLSPSLSDLSYIASFAVSNNKISGSLPPEYSAWTGLQTFSVWDNQISGILPPEYKAWTKLMAFYVENNKLSGTLPPEYSNWKEIKNFTAANNQIIGNLPSNRGNRTEIQRFEVENNQLQGNIPATYSGFVGAERRGHGFNLQNNQFTGDIPEFIQSWTTTDNVSGFIFISHNCFNTNLTGAIGYFLDSGAMEMGWSGGILLNSLKQFIGSGWRTTQNNCPSVPLLPLPPTTPTYVGGGGGGGISLVKDSCPNGDLSPSYYDKTCGTSEELSHLVTEKVNLLKSLIKLIFIKAKAAEKTLVHNLITSCSENNKNEVIKLACQELVENRDF